MKKLLLILPAVVLLATACNSQVVNNPTPSPVPQTSTSPQPSTTPTPPVNSDEIKFTGTIRDIKNGMSYDDNLIVTVDDKWVEVGQGGLRQEGTDPKPGQIIGFDVNGDLSIYIGKKAEVHGHLVPDDKNGVTIYGNTNYYFKVIN